MKGIKILYVEDEPYLAKIVRETLEKKGFQVNHILNGLKAMDAFREWEPDICILDVMLPGRDGFSIGSDIRMISPEIPIIYLTAKDQTDDLLKGFSSGGNDYIRKPFSLEELIARINNLLKIVGNQQNSTSEREIYQIGKLHFTASKMELQTPDTSFQLSHRESEILKMLCSNMNGVTERKQILLQIWGDDSFFNSRNLDVYIRKLRKYLGEDPSIQLMTLKGIGYRLVEA